MSPSDIIGILRECNQIADKAKNMELYSKILDAEQAVIDLRQDNMELQEENKNLREVSQKKIVYNEDRTTCFEELDDGRKEGPYCTCCWEDKKKLISLHTFDNDWGKIFYKCPLCEHEVLKEIYQQDPATVI